jgi:nicotinamidase-related amidase
MGERAEILKVRLVDYLKSFPKTRLFVREKRAMEDSFYITDKTHSVATTDDFQILPELNKYADSFLDKIRYNAFFETTLDTFLRQKKARYVGIVGLETHTSVLFTAEELRNRGYEVSVIEPCTMSRDDYMHSAAISLLKHTLGVGVTNG